MKWSTEASAPSSGSVSSYTRPRSSISSPFPNILLRTPLLTPFLPAPYILSYPPSCFPSHSRCSPTPHACEAIEHGLSLCTRFLPPEPLLELLGFEENRIWIAVDGEIDGSGYIAGTLELPWFADVDEDAVRRGGRSVCQNLAWVLACALRKGAEAVHLRSCMT